MKTFSKFMTVAISVLALVASTNTASAREASDLTPGEVAPAVAEDAREIAADALGSLPGGAHADLGMANVAQPAGTDNVIVAVQVTGDGYDEGSYAAAVVDLQAGTVSQEVQMKVTHLSDRSADLVYWENGVATNSTTITVPADMRSSDDAMAAASSNNIIECLNALGISTIAAWAIVSGCAAFCAVTVGAGCIACVAGFTAVAGVAVGGCLNPN